MIDRVRFADQTTAFLVETRKFIERVGGKITVRERLPNSLEIFSYIIEIQHNFSSDAVFVSPPKKP
ncbi:hypothetical protein JVX88_11140 [Leptolyngbya sp. 7M]|nr:hypothetical protein [Leptolyngbya sp. 7M]QYO68928.1 hypothetical protein JVX88_11140 [Leptolyngbya sp. 7M]